MAKKHDGKLKQPCTSRGMDGKSLEITEKTHRVGTSCQVERNDSNPGQYILWFGTRRYSKCDAVELHNIVDVKL